MTLLDNGFTILSQYIKNIFCIHLKHSSIWPSADVKPMSNDTVHGNPSELMSALSMGMLRSLR
jgi:hypothetical protein